MNRERLWRSPSPRGDSNAASRLLLRLVIGLGLVLLCASCGEKPATVNQPSGPNTFHVGGNFTFTPDGSSFIIEGVSGSPSDNEGDLYTVSSDGTKLSKIADSSDKDFLSVSPDGKLIAYVNIANTAEQGQIYVMNRDGTNSRRLTNFGGTYPSWSPDGSKIVYAHTPDNRFYPPGSFSSGMAQDYDIWQMNADGTSRRALTDGKYDGIDPPHYSPDGKHILFAVESIGSFASRHQLMILDIGPDGSATNLRPVPLPPAAPVGSHNPKYGSIFDGDPSYSADGSKIVFTSLRVSRPSPFDYEIWTANIDGTNLRQITHNQSRNQNPAFSPDGKYIYFTKAIWPCGLWRVGIDGSNLQQLLP